MNETDLKAHRANLSVTFKELTKDEYLKLSLPMLDYHTIYCANGENDSLIVRNVAFPVYEHLEDTQYLGRSHTLLYNENGPEIVQMYEWLCKATPGKYVLLRATPYHYNPEYGRLTLVESQSWDDTDSHYTYHLLTREQWEQRKEAIRLTSYFNLWELLAHTELKTDTE